MPNRLFMLFLGGLASLSPLSLVANNLQLSNLTLVDSQTLKVSAQWQHSWNLEGEKPPYNHDAAWLFLKYQKEGSNQWQHVSLSSQNTDHEITRGDPGLVSLDAVRDETGLFIKRRQRGSGAVPQQTLSIQLAEPLAKGRYQFRAFGIEMVNVKTDSFYLGDGASNHTLQYANSGKPFKVTHDGSIPVGNSGNKLTSADKFPPAGDIPEDYPTGYEGFYAMKYEISQAQYVSFLNTLSTTQQANHIGNDPTASKGTLAFPRSRGNRNGIVIKEPAKGDQPAVFACDANPNSPIGAVDDGQNRACNFLKWADVAAYLDWAGLSPMTETAFEKLCRGPKQPVKLGFAWGTDKVTDANNVVKDGTPLESVKEPLKDQHGLASHGYAGPKGPLRNGFGGTDSSNRLSIGAAYYGALELSGNLWEMVVTLNAEGLTFKGQPGDGELGSRGYANEPNWPGQKGRGAGFRGGAWNSGILQEFRDLAVSDRFYIYDQPKSRRETSGGRGVRYWD
jgi:formylglycine-generating enzyme required for sulfatase activity